MKLTAHHVQSVLYLRPKQNGYAAVVEFFRKHRILELARESGGCIAASLLVPTSGDGPMAALATWRTEADYSGWVNNPNRAAFTPGLVELLETDPMAGETYSVAIDVAE